MKNISHFLALTFLVLLSSCANDKKETEQGREIGRLYLSKAKPQPGDLVYLSYKKEKDSTEEAPQATMNYLVYETSYPLDIDLADSSGIWQGKVNIPDSAHAVAFNFERNGKFESNSKNGYVISLYNEEGEELPGANTSKGTYYLRDGSNYNIDIPKDSALAMFEKDFEKNPDLAEHYDAVYPNMLMNNNPEAGKKYIDRRIIFYTEKDSLSEKDYQALISLYKIRKEKAKVDSIQSLAVTKFPKGDAAKTKYMDEFYAAKNFEKRKAIYEDYLAKIGGNGRQKDFMLQYLALDLANEGKFREVEKYTSQIENQSVKASLYNSIAWRSVEKGENLEDAEKLSKESLEIIKNLKNDLSQKPDYYSERQFESSLEGSKSMYMDTYAFIKYKLGDLEEAAKLQEEALGDGLHPDVNTRYVQFLTELGQHEKAREKAEEFMKQNRATARMREYLEVAYAETNDSKEGYDAYLASIEHEADNNLMEVLEKEMLNEEAPAFNLKDLEGNEVELSSLKGKTVILDFWATWCGPCIASFPGMKNAVEEFKDNPDVQFYFVDTFENTPTRKDDVTEFIAKNNYPFHVLMDETMGEESNSFRTADAYGIRGIPTKVIIGPEGKLRFKSVGYSGNNEKMVKEIGYMIALTQRDKSPQA